MLPTPAPRLRAVLLALLVTCLWSTSWVVIKLAVADIPALTFAGLRYAVAWLCLLPIALTPRHRAELRALSGRDWRRLAALGLVFYAVTQGAQFVGLSRLPAVTVSLLLNCTPVAVAGLALVWLGERPTPRQWGGTALYLVGALVYFGPQTVTADHGAGLAVVAVGVVANAISAVLGRDVNREAKLPPLIVTVVSMGVGAAALLLGGLAAQGLPALDPVHWLAILWLAAVNTALAFTLWNRAQRTLTALESSLINSTMLVQIALLAWWWLGEAMTPLAVVGIALAGAGALLVQLRGRGR